MMSSSKIHSLDMLTVSSFPLGLDAFPFDQFSGGGQIIRSNINVHYLLPLFFYYATLGPPWQGRRTGVHLSCRQRRSRWCTEKARKRQGRSNKAWHEQRPPGPAPPTSGAVSKEWGAKPTQDLSVWLGRAARPL